MSGEYKGPPNWDPHTGTYIAQTVVHEERMPEKAAEAPGGMTYVLNDRFLESSPDAPEVREAYGEQLVRAFTNLTAKNERTLTAAEVFVGKTVEAKTYDDGKPPLAVLPWAALRVMARVQAYGERKYKDFYNYRKGLRVSRNLSCAMRHIGEYMDGNDIDPESGEPHLGHAMVRIGYVLQNIADGKAIDDRYKSQPEKQ